MTSKNFSAKSRRHPLLPWAAAILASLPLVSIAAHAQSLATIKIGGFTKKTSGIVTRIEDGDAGCYVTFKDDAGGEFDEVADFAVCEKKSAYKGQRVAMTYKLSTMRSDECQGNVKCKKTQAVALITALAVQAGRPAVGTGSAAPRATSRPKGGEGQTSFCTPMETIVFACRVGAKLVSVCASNNAGPNQGYMQYRFGKRQSPEPMELTIPDKEMAPNKVATGRFDPHAGGASSWLRFRKGQFSYVVFSGIGRWGPKGEVLAKEGVVVERGDKVMATLRCTGPLTSELGPDWIEKMGMKSGDSEEVRFPD